MYLNELVKGQKAQIISVAVKDRQLRQRLYDMGLTKKTNVEICKVAPLGDPFVIFVRGYELCLRKSDCEAIEIRLL
ncbi:MAG: ferrous iron transport protein A [Erysipelotrichales bacterium]|nr:ferrous iron transport protein A [Erysipelotrichales bacterium]